jgi:hypothetical protein
VPQPSRRCCRPSGRHGLPARTLAIRRPCAGNWRRRGPVDIEQCSLHLCGHPYLAANRGPIRPAVAQGPPSPTQRAREWELGRYCAYQSRWPDTASCLPSPAVRNSLPEPPASPPLPSPACRGGRWCRAGAAGPARRGHGSEQPRHRAAAGAAVRGGDRLPRAGHSDLPGDRRPVRRGPDPGTTSATPSRRLGSPAGQPRIGGRRVRRCVMPATTRKPDA